MHSAKDRESVPRNFPRGVMRDLVYRVIIQVEKFSGSTTRGNIISAVLGARTVSTEERAFHYVDGVSVEEIGVMGNVMTLDRRWMLRASKVSKGD